MSAFWDGFEKAAVSEKAISSYLKKRLIAKGMDPSAAHSLSRGYTGLETLMKDKTLRNPKQVEAVKRRLKALHGADFSGEGAVKKFHDIASN